MSIKKWIKAESEAAYVWFNGKFQWKKETYYGDTTLPDLHFVDKKKRDVCGKQY